MVSVPEVEGSFPSRQSVEAFIEKVEQTNKERKENLDWLVLKAQEDPKGEKVCVENEVIFACRDALQQQGVDWQNVQEPHAGIAPAQEEIEIKRLMSVANTTDVYAKPVSDGLCHRARTMLVDRGIDWHTGLALSVVGDHVRRWYGADESQLSLYAQGVLSRARVFQPDDAAKFSAQELQLLDNATRAARGTFKDDRDRRDAYERLVVVVDYLGEQLMKRVEHTGIQQPEQGGRLPDADFYQQYIRTHFEGYSDDSIQKVSDALVRITEEHTKFPDWDERESVQSQMRAEAKRALRSYGFGNATDVVDLMMTHVLPQDHPLNRPKMLVYSAGEYGGSEKGEERRTLAHSLKKFGSDTAVRAVVDKMVGIFNKIPLEDKKKMVLVPVPGSSGQPTYMKEVVRKLSELTHIPFTDDLFCDAHESLYHLKKYGAGYNSLPDIHYMMDGRLPSGAIAVLVDNVLDTGKTLSSAAKANFGEGVEVRAAVLAHTDYYEANNPQLVVKTASKLNEENKASVEKYKSDIKAGYAAALAALEVSQQGVDADTVDSMKGLLKVSWFALFGRNEARERLLALGVDWQTGQAVSSAAAVPVSFQLVPQNHVSMVSDAEQQMMGLIAADLATGNHLLHHRPVAQRELMAEIHGAFAAVKTLSVTPRQRDLLLSLSSRYFEGFAEIARQSEVSEAVLMDALKRVDQVRPAVAQDIAVHPYQIYYEDDAFVVDYSHGYGFADKIVRQVAATHDGQSFERVGRTMVLFDSERNVYSFIEHVQNLRIAVANNLRNGIIDKLRRAGISVNTNVEEGERILQQVNTKPRLMAVDRTTNEYKKKVSDAEQRIESQLAELNRSRNEDGSIAQPASRVPVKEPTSPSIDGDRDASSSTAKVRNKFDSSKFLAEKMAIYNISPRQDIREQRAVSADMRYMLVPDSPSPIFISNARMALDKIKQEKATPEQWLNMIEKHGGMKAGEDRWTGLSGWLRSSEERILTKQQVIDYINENQIQIEEVHYGNVDDFNSSDAVKAYQKEFDELKQALVDHREEMKDAAHREYSEYCSAMQEKYGVGWEGLLAATERVQERALQKRYELYVSGYGTDNDDIAFSEMTIRHSPQSLRWQRAFYHENGRLMIDDETDAVSFLGEAHFINSTRLKFTTKGLDDKREIALVVPTIESWNEYDIVHFGGAGDGRAVAWVRFGSTTTAAGERVLVLDEIQSKRHQEGRERGYRRDIRVERDAVAKVWKRQWPYRRRSISEVATPQ